MSLPRYHWKGEYDEFKFCDALFHGVVKVGFEDVAVGRCAKKPLASSTVYVGRQVLKRGVITVTGSIEGATAGRQRRKVLHWQEK
ncbi:hypothetical protein GW17_00061417 [Ensete ventricosum]|nr:hypothetical protein GW17_00061417 [Ensete ventricosum]